VGRNRKVQHPVDTVALLGFQGVQALGATDLQTAALFFAWHGDVIGYGRARREA
jgi:hypothetical protein